ncbi:hypothetical protein MGS_03347 [Candida albicans P78042]|nr:hypothetical protein MGS_03347 [Candida albicans P78042]
MGTTRVGVSVVFRFFQFVANIGCFATSLHTDPLNAFILTVTVLNFIYNCYIWFGVPIMGMRAYHGILFSGEILFLLLYIGSSVFQHLYPYIYYYYDYYYYDYYYYDYYYYDYYYYDYFQVASWSLGYSCAGLYYITFIMYVCWGVIPASWHGFCKRFFERQPFRFGCIVFDDSNLDNESKNKNVVCLEQAQNYQNNNFELKQNEVVNKDPIVF